MADRVLVSGGRGYIAGFLIRQLVADGWAEAMAGCTHVAHLASLLPRGVQKNADELIVPARDGALRVLRAARAAGVRRFVMTSSVAAIAYGRGRRVHHFTEADWLVGWCA